ncbi:MipA/OmpV family protein [Aureimonas mangrovi]|uniref:MipA/OmpV family protein n=1 Tax=Aureimonas mangrovi TaxID=2758041 RepID=UPI001FE74A1E|nr:MipA/OmpV family protein [Aureimonas mangrovi]
MSVLLRPLAALAFLTPLAAHAADTYDAGAYTPDTSEVAIANNADLVIELGIGGTVQPRYLGSDDYILSPSPIVAVSYLRLPGLLEVGGGPETAFSIGPSFRFIGERDPDDDSDLEGLRSLDRTYEAGLRAGYEVDFDQMWGGEIYGEARYAFGEAEGFVGGFGVNAIVRPNEVVELRFGPRAELASSEYMQTYFSISPDESIASGGRLSAFEADGGFYSVGVEAEARYEFRSNWFLTAEAGYQRLVGDAKDSPIVSEAGSADQFTAGLGISRRFSLDLF